MFLGDSRFLFCISRAIAVQQEGRGLPCTPISLGHCMEVRFRGQLALLSYAQKEAPPSTARSVSPLVLDTHCRQRSSQYGSVLDLGRAISYAPTKSTKAG